MMYIMSPEQPLHDVGGIGQIIDTTNMVLSRVPMDHHRLIQIQQQQHHQQQQNNNNNHHLNNNYSNNQNFNSIITNFHNTNNNNSSSNNNIINNMTAFTTINNNNHHNSLNSSQQSLMSSKLLVLHPEQLNDNYTDVNDGSNGVGNIVLLATEQMEITNADHDVINNNILNNVSSNNSNIITVNTDEELTPLTWLHDKNLLKGINLSCAKVQSSPESPSQQQMTAPLSPTSDFVEDSCVSEDNVSSTNSTSDQSIGVYCTESPTKSTYSLSYGNHTTSLMKSRRNSPSLMSTTSTSSEIGSPIYEHHYNSSGDSKLLSSPASTTSIASTNSIASYNSSTPHQHFHKKYLREEHVKTMKDNVHNGHLTTIKQEYSEIKIENCDNIKSEYCSSPSPTYEMSPTYEHMINTSISNKSMSNSIGNQRDTSSHNNSNNSSKTPNSQKQKHPTNVPYDPLVHITSKPPYSFSSLIFMAIEDSQQKALPVKEIYAWIVLHFPYFKTAPTGWKNSVRHNLSLNKCFQKVEKAANLGKGSLWMVENQFRPNLLQALTRSPFHPCSTLDKNAYNNKSANITARTTIESPPTVMKSGTRLPDPQHFPFLSRRLAAMEEHDQRGDQDSTSRSSTPTLDDEQAQSSHSYNYSEQQHYMNGGTHQSVSSLPLNENLKVSVSDYNSGTVSADSSIEDVNAATAMLALKHGPKIFSETFTSNNSHPPVITSSPSEDHTYSAGGAGASAGSSSAVNGVVVNRSTTNTSDNSSNETPVSDVAAYESSDESHHNLQTNNTLLDTEQEERRRHAEGVDALLNLAGITNYSTAKSSPISTGTTTILLKRPASLNFCEKPSYGPQPQQQQFFHSQQPYQAVQQQQYNHEEQNSFTTTSMPHQQQYILSSPSPAKKLKSSSNRSLKSRLKKKSWLR